MSAILENPSAILFRNASWDFYLRVREEMSDATHVIFNKGKLEVMSPISIGHEGDKALLARLLTTYCEVRNIPLDAAGGLTLRRESLQVALEPDESFYLQTSPPPRDAGVLDLSIHAPPDLAVEIEHSHSAIDKEPIYAAIGVSELWRWDGERFRIRILRSDRTGYDPSTASRLLPSLPVDALAEHLRLAKTRRQSEVVRSWMAFLATVAG